MRRPAPEPPLPKPPVAAWLGLAIYVVMLLVLPVLKLASITRVANWSWGWVLTPLWGPWVLVGLWSVFGPLFQRQHDDGRK